MNNFEKVKEVIELILLNNNKNTHIDISENSRLREDIGFDSLDLAEFTVRIENEFGVDVFEDGIVETVKEVIDKIK